MPPHTRQRILPIEQLNSEWRTLGRSPGAVRALHYLADRDPTVSVLVRGTDGGPSAAGSTPVCDPVRPDRLHAPGHGQPGPRGSGGADQDDVA